jgi:hypothetical protein
VKALTGTVIGVAILIGAIFMTGQLALAVNDYGGGSVQSYAADTPIDRGAIVELSGENADRVKVATQDNVSNMFGVAVDRNALPLTLSSGKKENEVFVAVSGTHNVLVSTQAGAIKKGDYLTLSSINGVAMKAGTDKTTVFGRANGNFDGKGVILGTTTLKDTAGSQDKIVKLGSLPVTIDIRTNPNDISTKVNIIEQLQRAGKQIAEKEVSPVRIYLSIAIAVICIIVSIIILYAGVRNGVISIGRNPMSKKSIFRALLEIILTVLLILIIGLFAVYLLLKL